MKIWVLSDNRGFFLKNEENLAKMFCELYGGNYWADEIHEPKEDGEETEK